MRTALETRVKAAKGSDAELDALLHEYRPFIVSAVLANCPKAQDDHIHTGMMAFAQAVYSFEEEKGSFLSFAKLLISRRVIDQMRKDTANRELAVLDVEDDQTEQLINMASRQVHDMNRENEERREEIRMLSEELAAWSMSFGELADSTPRHTSTRAVCKKAIKAMLVHAEWMTQFQQKKKIPMTQLARTVGVSTKVLEKHRRYLVAALLVHTGDYQYIRDYIRLDDSE